MAEVVHWGKYFPPDFGGVENVTSSLARAAAISGHRVTVVCFHKGRASWMTTAEGARLLRAPIEMVKASQPVGLTYLRWVLREGRRADLVHLHAPNFVAAVAALLVGRRPMLIVHWHSDVIGKGWLGRVLQPLERAMLRRADSIICTSSAYAEGSTMVNRFLHKVTVIPIGVPDLAPKPNQPRSGLPEALSTRLTRPRLVLAVGRLVPYKGFGVLIEAARHLPDDVCVVIVGTGPLQTELEARIRRLGLTDKVVLAGRQPEAVLKALFSCADLFCLPSVERSEAFGVVLVEAMCHALPIVATQIPGSGVAWVNQHEQSGLNVPPGDAEALAEACNRILGSRCLRERLARGSRLRFEREFTEGASCSRMLALYSALMSSRRPATPS